MKILGDLIITGGTIGVGTAVPAKPLHVVGDIRVDGSSLYIENVNFGNSFALRPVDSASHEPTIFTFGAAAGLSAIGTSALGFQINVGGKNLRFNSTTADNVLMYMNGNLTGFDLGGSSGSLEHRFYTVGANRGNVILNNNQVATGDVQIKGRFDANLFYTDASTDRVGIGTATPTAKLHVKGTGDTSASEAFLIEDTNSAIIMVAEDGGNIGIGTASPVDLLHVEGDSDQVFILSGNGAFELGLGASTNDPGAVTIGNGATTSGTEAIAIGQGANASGLGAIAIGPDGPTAPGIRNIAIGKTAATTANGDIAIGPNSEALGDNSQGSAIAIGNNAKAESNTGGSNVGNSISIGYQAGLTSSGARTINSGGISIGHRANFSTSSTNYDIGQNAIAIGRVARTSGTTAIAIGQAAFADANYSIAIGRSSNTTALRSFMFGVNSSLLSSKGMINSVADSVAFGWSTNSSETDPQVLFAKTASQYIGGSGNLGIGIAFAGGASAAQETLHVSGGTILDGNLGINVSPTASDKVYILGNGSTDATANLRMDNTGGEMWSFNDDNSIDRSGTVWSHITPNINSTFIGVNAGNKTVLTGINNTALGSNAGRYWTTAANSVAIGYQAFGSTLSLTPARAIAIGNEAGIRANGSDTILMGYRAGYRVNGTRNVAIGRQSLGGNSLTTVTGADNIAIGFATMGAHTSGAQNIALGYSAGANLDSGGNNVFMGYRSGNGINSGHNNVAIGQDAFLDTTGAGTNQNVGIGRAVGQNIGTGAVDNVHIGSFAGQGRTTGAGFSGQRNIWIGYQSGQNFGSAVSDTVAFGYKSGGQIGTSGNRNICIGFQSGYDGNAGGDRITGDDNILIGQNAKPTAYASTDELVIGRMTAGEIDNATAARTATIRGDLANRRIGINVGEFIPTHTLELGHANENATFQFTDGNQSDGHTLISDSGGTATWQTLAAPSYTVSSSTGLTATAGRVIFVSDESGGSILAFGDGTDWRRVTDRAVIT